MYNTGNLLIPFKYQKGTGKSCDWKGKRASIRKHNIQQHGHKSNYYQGWVELTNKKSKLPFMINNNKDRGTKRTRHCNEFSNKNKNTETKRRRLKQEQSNPRIRVQNKPFESFDDDPPPQTDDEDVLDEMARDNIVLTPGKIDGMFLLSFRLCQDKNSNHLYTFVYRNTS